MTIFQRARSEEQRELRRRAILDTAAEMLTEMPVARVSLNELSRRVGLAKSNVLRYFESREAVLLQLLDTLWREWLAHLEPDLDQVIDPTAELAQRVDQLAAGLAASLAARPVLCDLLSAQAAVLEHNLSSHIAAEYKRTAIANVTALSELLGRHVGELVEADSGRLAAGTVMMAGAIWSHTQPSAAMIAAYEAAPDLAALRLDFARTLQEVLEVFISGLLARSSR